MGCLESLTTPIVDFVLGICGIFTNCSDAFCGSVRIKFILTIIIATVDLLFDWINFVAWFSLREPYSSGYGGYMYIFGISAVAGTLIYIVELFFMFQMFRGTVEKDDMPGYVKFTMVLSIIFEDALIYVGYLVLSFQGGCGLEALEEMYSTIGILVIVTSILNTAWLIILTVKSINSSCCQTIIISVMGTVIFMIVMMIMLQPDFDSDSGGFGCTVTCADDVNQDGAIFLYQTYHFDDHQKYYEVEVYKDPYYTDFITETSEIDQIKNRLYITSFEELSKTNDYITRAIPCHVAFPFMVNFAFPDEVKQMNMFNAECRYIGAARFSENNTNEIFYTDGIQILDGSNCFTVDMPRDFISPQFMTKDVVNDLGKYRCATLTEEPFCPETVYSKLKNGPADLNEDMKYSSSYIYIYSVGKLGRDCELIKTKIDNTDLCTEFWLNIQTDPMDTNNGGYLQFIYPEYD